MTPGTYVNVQGRILKLSNLNKIFYPENGFAKKQIISYYRRLAPAVLPHLKDRPFTLKRFPDGIDAPAFFEKQCPFHRPPWIQTAHFGPIRHCLVNDLASLIWVVNLAAIELHTTLARIVNLNCPTMMVFDLDPGEGVGLAECAEVAILLKERFAALRLDAYPKSSGKKGLHVYIPLNTPTSYGETKPFARAIAESLERRHPDRVTARMAKKVRPGKIFIDWSQNTDFKTTTTVYSLRANDRPTVSTPLTWREVQIAARRASKAQRLLAFETEEVLKRIEKQGDLFANVLTMAQRLPELQLRTAA